MIPIPMTMRCRKCTYIVYAYDFPLPTKHDKCGGDVEPILNSTINSVQTKENENLRKGK